MNIKRIFGSLLTLLGLGGLIYCAVLVINTSGGTHDVKTLITFGILGVVFFISGISLIRTTRDESGSVNDVTNSKSCVTPLSLYSNIFEKYIQKIISMSLLNIVIILIVIGVLLWLVNTYIPMDGKIKKILNIVVVIAVILWILRVFGILGALSGIDVGNEDGGSETWFGSQAVNPTIIYSSMTWTWWAGMAIAVLIVGLYVKLRKK